jgi:hypothetical protein
MWRGNFIVTEKVLLPLTQSEALVLFEFCSRFSNDNVLRIDDQAEERILWDICALLESTLVQPFNENYQELLEKVRAEVRDPVP